LIAQSEYATGRCLWQLNRKLEAGKLLNHAFSIYIKEPKKFGEQIREIEAMGVK